MNEDQILDFKNDVLFKYSLGQSNPESIHLLSTIIYYTTGIECHELIVTNPEFTYNHASDKDMILDIKAQDHQGIGYNIEMQNSHLYINHRIRFQVYGARMIESQLHKGDDYIKIKPTIQIILVNDVDKDDLRLMDTFTSKNQDGKEEMYNINTRIYLYIPYINEIAKHKPLEEFNEFEKMMYVFQNGLNNDIMRLENQSKVIQIMDKKLEEFNSDEKLLDLAFRKKLNKITQKGVEQEIYDEGKKETQKQNVKQMLEFKYPLEDISFIENLSYEQYQDIFTMLLQDKDITDIQNYILK